MKEVKLQASGLKFVAVFESVCVCWIRRRAKNSSKHEHVCEYTGVTASQTLRLAHVIRAYEFHLEGLNGELTFDFKMPKPKGLCWEHVEKVAVEAGEAGTPASSSKDPKVKCKFCGFVFHGGATRILFHLLGLKGGGVKRCTGNMPEEVRSQLAEMEEEKEAKRRRSSQSAIDVASDLVLALRAANKDEDERTPAPSPRTKPASAAMPDPTKEALAEVVMPPRPRIHGDLQSVLRHKRLLCHEHLP